MDFHEFSPMASSFPDSDNNLNLKLKRLLTTSVFLLSATWYIVDGIYFHIAFMRHEIRTEMDFNWFMKELQFPTEKAERILNSDTVNKKLFLFVQARRDRR